MLRVDRKHLMDEHLAFLKPKNVSLEEAATIGVGALVRSFQLDEKAIVNWK